MVPTADRLEMLSGKVLFDMIFLKFRVRMISSLMLLQRRYELHF